MSSRSLVRLLRDKVGVSAKWLVERYRMHEALEQLVRLDEKEHRRALADLAHALGYSDQAHFSNAFRRVVGVSPGRYHATHRDKASR